MKARFRMPKHILDRVGYLFHDIIQLFCSKGNGGCSQIPLERVLYLYNQGMFKKRIVKKVNAKGKTLLISGLLEAIEDDHHTHYRI